MLNDIFRQFSIKQEAQRATNAHLTFSYRENICLPILRGKGKRCGSGVKVVVTHILSGTYTYKQNYVIYHKIAPVLRLQLLVGSFPFHVTVLA